MEKSASGFSRDFAAALKSGSSRVKAGFDAQADRCFAAKFKPVSGYQGFKREFHQKGGRQQPDNALPEDDCPFSKNRRCILDEINRGLHVGEEDSGFR